MQRGQPTQDDGVAAARIDWAAELQRHGRWLRTVVASRVGDRSSVDDVMQEVGLAVARRENRPADAAKVGPWLYRVALRQCLMQRRTLGRKRRKEELWATEGWAEREAPVDPLDWLLQSERQQAIRAALGQLPDLDRQVLLLKYTEEWTYRDLAERLGVTENTVEYRLLRARDRLRRLMAQQSIVEVQA